jgi:pimeloyl-ACP methyl ester carboxylesterase
MKLLRRAVGDPQLNYLGVSYDTYLGATYANLVPGKVRAIAGETSGLASRQRGGHVCVGTGCVSTAPHDGCLRRRHGTPATVGERPPVQVPEEGR